MHSHLISRLPSGNALCHFNTIYTNISIMHIFSNLQSHHMQFKFDQPTPKFCSLELITIPFPMAYAHNYILYNYGIMLTHQALTYYFHTTQAIHFNNFIPKHMDIYGPFHTNWDCFYSPKIEKVGCPWAAHASNIGSTLRNQIS